MWRSICLLDCNLFGLTWYRSSHNPSSIFVNVRRNLLRFQTDHEDVSKGLAKSRGRGVDVLGEEIGLIRES
jgi:hypothetical protein